MPTNSKNVLRDALGVAIPQAFDSGADNYMALLGSGGAMLVKPSVAYDSKEDMVKVQSMQKKFKDSFTGSSLDATKWDIISQGTGQTISLAGGLLTIVAGTTINAETILQSKEVFTDPIRAIFGCYISQRIINQEFFLELVSVDPITLAADGKSGASFRISGDDTLTTTNAIYEVWNGGNARLASASSNIVNATTTLNMFEIELATDEVWFHTRGMDSTSGRSASFVRHQQTPDPNSFYKIRIRAKNKGTAPATNTNFIFQFASGISYSEITAEITSGRGNIAAGQGMSVTVANSPSVSISGKPTIQGGVAHDGAVGDNPLMMGAYAHATGQTAVSADGDITRLWADRQGRLAIYSPPIGAHANAWNATAASANGTSTALDTNYVKTVSVFGNVSAATNITVQYSQDNTNWYDSDKTITIAAAGNFGATFDTGARYVRLKSSAAATITATIAGKA